MRCASWRASGKALPSGACSSARPMAAASAPLTSVAHSISLRACATPTRAGSDQNSAASGMAPTRVKAQQNTALWPATTTSQAVARPRPAP